MRGMGRAPKHGISQAQIAAELGCSQSLVSRVLNGRHGGIPDETVQAIWEHANRHGYRPRGINLDLFVSEMMATQMVGFVLRSPLRLITESHVFQHAHQGMHEYLQKRNVRTVYLGSEDELDAAALVKTVEKQELMLGLMLMGEVQPGFVRILGACRKPVVMISAQYPGVCHSIVSNLVQAANLLVEHLVKLGHKRFGWIGSVHGVGKMLKRKEATLQALRSYGLELSPAYELDMPEADRQNGHRAMAELLTRSGGQPPTAIICHNAMMARGAINHLFQHGWRVPQDISVVAIDMTRCCEEEPPHITSAAAKPELLGEVAAQLILERQHTADQRLCEIMLPSELAVRESSGAVAVRPRPAKMRGRR